MKQKTISREELKDREFSKKAPQIFHSEQEAVFENTACSENEKFEEKPTPLKTDSSITSGITAPLSALFLIIGISLCLNAAASYQASLDPAMQNKYPKKAQIPPLVSPERFFFQLDLLAWDSREEGLEYAYKNTQTQSNQELTSFEPKSKFEPAFRIGAGGYLPYDGWIIGSMYTYYSTNRKNSANHEFNTQGAVGPGIIAVWTYPSAFLNNNTAARFETGKNHWKLHASFLDLSLGRACPIGAYFSMTPEWGLRAAWLHQRYTVHYHSGNQVQPTVGTPISIIASDINMNCASNNVGPFFGLKTNWRLGSGWNLFSNFSGAVLASRFHVGRGETDLFTNFANTVQTESVRLHNEYWAFRPQGQITLGFRFLDTAFRQSAHPLRYSFSAAYETQIWWRQNGLLRYLDTLNTVSSGAYVTPTQGDLMFHGVNLETSLSF